MAHSIDTNPEKLYLSNLKTLTAYGNLPQRIPPEPGETIGGGIGQAALDVVRGCHSPDQATQRAKLSKDQQWNFDRQVKEQEEIALRRWVRQYPEYLVNEREFTRKWQQQGFIQGAEHQLYFEGGYAYKRNNLAYHTTWFQYLDRVALHNWLFSTTALTLIGFTYLDGDLQPVVQQKIFESIRGASREEVEVVMQQLEFHRIRNDDYLDDYGYLRVEDLHDENVLVSPQNQLIIFDPVIYRIAPVYSLLPSESLTVSPH